MNEVKVINHSSFNVENPLCESDCVQSSIHRYERNIHLFPGYSITPLSGSFFSKSLLAALSLTILYFIEMTPKY